MSKMFGVRSAKEIEAEIKAIEENVINRTFPENIYYEKKVTKYVESQIDKLKAIIKKLRKENKELKKRLSEIDTKIFSDLLK